MNATTTPHDATWRRLLAALPDLAMAGVFIAVWIAPLAFPRDQLKGLALVMLLEFFLLHASVLLGVVVQLGLRDASKRTWIALGTALALMYLAFVWFLATSFDASWPYLAFAWLLASKLSGVVFSPARPEDERARQMGIWIGCCVAYLLLFFPTALIPLPAVGLTPEVVATLEVSGFGAWIEQPQRLCLYGFLYFTACAILRANVEKGIRM